MEKSEIYKYLDKFDFSKVLRTLFFENNIDDIGRLQTEIYRATGYDNVASLAMKYLHDFEIMEYFKLRYKVEFRKHVSYSIDIDYKFASSSDKSLLRK